MEHHHVTLIVDEHYAPDSSTVDLGHPVWIVRSAANDRIVDRWRQRNSIADVTTFERQLNESNVATCARIVESLDQHFNELSQAHGYVELRVVGAPLDRDLRDSLKDLGFTRFESTARSFMAFKSEVQQGTLSGAAAAQR